MQGEDTYSIPIAFESRPPGGRYSDEKGYTATISPTWNEIFAGVAPVLINEANEASLQRAFRQALTKISQAEFNEHKDLKDHTLKSFSFQSDDIYTCMIQLRALGLIKESDKKRSIRDTATYWTLTPYGDQLMVQLRAISRIPKKTRRIGSAATESTENKN